MIFVGNVPVLASIYQIMVELQRELRTDGSLLLHDIIPPRYDGQDVMITCPYHKNGMENKPSCGVTTCDIKKDGNVIPAGTMHCFTCGVHGNITKLVSYCFGKNDGGLFGKNWILDRFNNYELENREGFFNKIGTGKKVKNVTYVTEDELKNYRYYHPYMYERGLTDDIIDIFDIGYDKSFKLREDLRPFGCITFPIKDENGNVLFVARRGITFKIFHYPSNVDKPLAYLYEAQKLYPNEKTLWIVESLFNSLTLFRWGKPSVALLGTGSQTQIEKLKKLPYRKYVICTDGDDAGRKASNKLYNSLREYKFIEQLKMMSGKDVNDFKHCKSYDEFLNELKEGMKYEEIKFG